MFKVTEFQKGLTIKELTEISSKSENQKSTLTLTEKASITYHCKGYDDG
jgi:hypothetical protein